MTYENCDNPCCDGVLGMIKKGTQKHLEQIPGTPDFAEMQKVAHTGTTYILRKTLSM